MLIDRSPTETLTALEDPDSTRLETLTRKLTSTSLLVPVDPLLPELPTPTNSTPTGQELQATRMAQPTATPTSKRPRAERVPVVLVESYVLVSISIYEMLT
jgi:hypothetical protein